MGKINIITKEQKLILDEFRKDDFLRQTFYFTGGTALSLYYLQHRLSVDLDFFSEKDFDSQIILDKLYLWGTKHHFSIHLRTVENTHMFTLDFAKGKSLKVDFAYYPYPLLEKVKDIEDLRINSLMDIAVNKLTAASQRDEIKDFVDLYFLLKTYSIWDLIRGVEVKFKLEIDPVFLGMIFMKAEKFDYLPKMILPLELPELKDFFKEKAREVTKKIVI